MDRESTEKTQKKLLKCNKNMYIQLFFHSLCCFHLKLLFGETFSFESFLVAVKIFRFFTRKS